MIPSLDALMAAQNAINAQQVAAMRDRLIHDVDGRLVLRLSAEHVSTICAALGITSAVACARTLPEPEQVAWAAIIDGGLMARGSAGLSSESLAALERVELATLERMAALVLGERRDLGPDTPETVAAKAKAARGAFDAFHNAAFPTKGF